jgi:drug/metabolite transporter (DMT)-like permease
MDPALWGAVTATTWGTADFIARYTSRAMGTTVALTGVLIISGLGLTLLAWDDLAALSWRAQGGPLAVAGGIGITFATLLLYWGLARGPVTVVAPITACYPAFAMLIAVARGGRPGAMELLAIAIVLVGVVVVARFAVEDGGEHGYSHDHVRKSAWIGLAAAAGFAVAVLVGRPGGNARICRYAGGPSWHCRGCWTVSPMLRCSPPPGGRAPRWRWLSHLVSAR